MIIEEQFPRINKNHVKLYFGIYKSQLFDVSPLVSSIIRGSWEEKVPLSSQCTKHTATKQTIPWICSSFSMD